MQVEGFSCRELHEACKNSLERAQNNFRHKPQAIQDCKSCDEECSRDLQVSFCLFGCEPTQNMLTECTNNLVTAKALVKSGRAARSKDAKKDHSCITGEKATRYLCNPKTSSALGCQNEDCDNPKPGWCVIDDWTKCDESHIKM